MIDSDNILEHMRQESYRPLSYHELKDVLGVSEEEENKFIKELGHLEKDGEIVRTRKNKYGLPEMMNLVRGTIRLNQRGYGILVPDDATRPEVFVYSGGLNGAMHSDKVMVRLSAGRNGGQRPEGEVIRVIKRANQQLVGTYERGRKRGQVIPDDNRHFYPIYIRPVRKMAVKDGDKVLVNITSWPDRDQALEGKIIEVLGRKGEPGLDLQVVIKKHGLRTDFPKAVLEEAGEVAQPVTAAEIIKRRDLRDWRMVTIDGEDAKDLDDAVSISRIPAGYRLGVHIADVSHYVTEGSRLDQEAFARGTSVYLINKVLPMLPPELSNNICSLNANQERLAMSCIMDIDPDGKVISYDICKSIINIRKRMTYTAVNRILADDAPEEKARYQELLEDFYLMKELADILRAGRTRRGSLDFDFPESKIIVDDNSFPVEIRRLERGPGEMLIEDFMIKANEVVAEHMYAKQVPILYRVHEKPDEESLDKLNLVLGGLGHKIKTKKIEPAVYQKLLEDIKGKPEEQMLSMLLLRSMKHARYTPEALGHFGLASKYYCHFTSPIRRYPDLIVHRVLTLMLDKSINAKTRASLEAKMLKYGEHSSLQEQKAEEAERDLIDLKKAEYMQQYVGEQFTARISSVQSFGFFVELENTIEGLVHISTIADDYYEFNDRDYTLIGTHTGRKFAIGDEVNVQLVRVDIDDAQIDFELI
jgi:ribonuclease R